jgi:hypothetical protein
MKRKSLIFAAILLIMIGCKQGSSPKPVSDVSKGPEPSAPPPFSPAFTGGTEKDAIRNIIVRYDELLTFGYRTLNMNPLQEVTTEDEAEKVYIYMAALGEGKVRMISHVNNIYFDSITFPAPDKAVVRTKEIWDFAYTDIKTGEKKEEKKNFIYLMTYTLGKEGGRWLITAASATSTEKAGEKLKPRSLIGDGDLGKVKSVMKSEGEK